MSGNPNLRFGTSCDVMKGLEDQVKPGRDDFISTTERQRSGPCNRATEIERTSLSRKLDDEWPESIFHHVGSQSARYLLSVL